MDGEWLRGWFRGVLSEDEKKPYSSPSSPIDSYNKHGKLMRQLRMNEINVRLPIDVMLKQIHDDTSVLDKFGPVYAATELAQLENEWERYKQVVLLDNHRSICTITFDTVFNNSAWNAQNMGHFRSQYPYLGGNGQHVPVLHHTKRKRDDTEQESEPNKKGKTTNTTEIIMVTDLILDIGKAYAEHDHIGHAASSLTKATKEATELQESTSDAMSSVAHTHTVYDQSGILSGLKSANDAAIQSLDTSISGLSGLDNYPRLIYDICQRVTQATTKILERPRLDAVPNGDADPHVFVCLQLVRERFLSYLQVIRNMLIKFEHECGTGISGVTNLGGNVPIARFKEQLDAAITEHETKLGMVIAEARNDTSNVNTKLSYCIIDAQKRDKSENQKLLATSLSMLCDTVPASNERKRPSGLTPIQLYEFQNKVADILNSASKGVPIATNCTLVMANIDQLNRHVAVQFATTLKAFKDSGVNFKNSFAVIGSAFGGPTQTSKQIYDAAMLRYKSHEKPWLHDVIPRSSCIALANKLEQLPKPHVAAIDTFIAAVNREPDRSRVIVTAMEAIIAGVCQTKSLMLKLN